MATDVSALFGALADARRRAILDLIKGRALTVNRIAEEFSVSRPAISRHLRVLRETGLVEEEKRGRQRFYALRPAAVAEAVEHLKPYLAGGPEKPDQPSRRSARRRESHPAGGSRPAPERPASRPVAERDDGWRCW